MILIPPNHVYHILFLFLENLVLFFWTFLQRMDGVFGILYLYPLYVLCCGIYLYFSLSIRCPIVYQKHYTSPFFKWK
jgi:hypothetical protein